MEEEKYKKKEEGVGSNGEKEEIYCRMEKRKKRRIFSVEWRRENEEKIV